MKKETRERRTKEANAHGKGILCRESSKLEEVRAVVDQANPTQHLCAVHADRNLGPTTIDALEAVPVRASHLEPLLKGIGSGYGCKVLPDIDLGRGKAAQNHRCVFKTALANEPPWTLWDKKKTWDDDETPKPLEMVSKMGSSKCLEALGLACIAKGIE